MLSGLLVVKMVAVSLGPSGVAIYAQAQNATVMLNGVIASPVGSGVVRAAAQREDEGNRLASALIASLTIMFVIWLICSLLVVTFNVEIFGWLKIDSISVFSVGVAIFGSLLSGIGTYLASLANGFENYRQIILVGCVSAIVSAVISVLIIYYTDTRFLFAVPAIYFSCIGIIHIICLGKAYFDKMLGIKKLKNEDVKTMLGFMAMAFTSITLTPLILIYIRGVLIEDFGFEMAGDWESSRRLLDIFSALLTTYFTMVLLPTLSKIRDGREFRRVVYARALAILLIVIPAYFAIYFFREIIYYLIYSKDFSFSANLLLTRMLGEFFKVLVWVFGFTMVVKAASGLYILTSVVSAGLLIVLTYWFVGEFGAIGVNYAYTLSNLIFLVVTIPIFYGLTQSPSTVSSGFS
jgi:PST family polysaccharide transporter